MKVICIDNKPIVGFSTEDNQPPLIVGAEYEVEVQFLGVFSRKLYYGISGRIWVQNECGDLAQRFIPLSDIDETEMVREYNLEKIS